VSKQPSQQPAFAARVNGEFEPLLDSEEAAALIKIHPKTLQRMARHGEITGIRIGKLWRFRASSLNRWLEKIAT
jgi:excisionase family DNA binding protein